MNKELALRTFAYLIGHYKTHNETTINKQEIEAIEFILKDNESLEQQCKKQKEVINRLKEYIEKHIKYECDDAYNGMQFYSYHLYDFNKQDLLDILKEV